MGPPPSALGSQMHIAMHGFNVVLKISTQVLMFVSTLSTGLSFYIYPGSLTFLNVRIHK